MDAQGKVETLLFFAMMIGMISAVYELFLPEQTKSREVPTKGDDNGDESRSL